MDFKFRYNFICLVLLLLQFTGGLINERWRPSQKMLSIQEEDLEKSHVLGVSHLEDRPHDSQNSWTRTRIPTENENDEFDDFTLEDVPDESESETNIVEQNSTPMYTTTTTTTSPQTYTNPAEANTSAGTQLEALSVQIQPRPSDEAAQSASPENSTSFPQVVYQGLQDSPKYSEEYASQESAAESTVVNPLQERPTSACQVYLGSSSPQPQLYPVGAPGTYPMTVAVDQSYPAVDSEKAVELQQNATTNSSSTPAYMLGYEPSADFNPLPYYPSYLRPKIAQDISESYGQPSAEDSVRKGTMVDSTGKFHTVKLRPSSPKTEKKSKSADINHSSTYIDYRSPSTSSIRSGTLLDGRKTVIIDLDQSTKNVRERTSLNKKHQSLSISLQKTSKSNPSLLTKTLPKTAVKNSVVYQRTKSNPSSPSISSIHDLDSVQKNYQTANDLSSFEAKWSQAPMNADYRALILKKMLHKDLSSELDPQTPVVGKSDSMRSAMRNNKLMTSKLPEVELMKLRVKANSRNQAQKSTLGFATYRDLLRFPESTSRKTTSRNGNTRSKVSLKSSKFQVADLRTDSKDGGEFRGMTGPDSSVRFPSRGQFALYHPFSESGDESVSDLLRRAEKYSKHVLSFQNNLPVLLEPRPQPNPSLHSNAERKHAKNGEFKKSIRTWAPHVRKNGQVILTASTSYGGNHDAVTRKESAFLSAPGWPKQRLPSSRFARSRTEAKDDIIDLDLDYVDSQTDSPDKHKETVPDLHCAFHPCLNGGLCVEHGLKGYECLCKSGYKGIDCEEEDHCHPNPCLNYGICTARSNQFFCTCPSGHLGTRCEETSNCQSNPCRNGGVCTDKPQGFVCTCQPGFVGSDCSTAQTQSACIPNPCQNGGVCSLQQETHQVSPVCRCLNPFAGQFCQEVDNCHGKVCHNGGTCIEGACVCRSEYRGPDCGESTDVCSHSPCINGGRCIVTGPGSFECHCAMGFHGVTCQEIRRCDLLECRHGGRCMETESGEVGCICPVGYKGLLCEIQDLCRPNPCLHGGSCYQNDNSITCVCKHNFAGSRCQDYVQICTASTCLNGGTCIPSSSGAACLCPSGYVGKYCQEQVRSAFRQRKLCIKPNQLLIPVSPALA